MSEESQSDSDLELLELRNFILRIPGEHFFCESVDLPSHLSVGDEQKEEEVIEEFLSEYFDNQSFSPYPQDQLAWGFYGSLENKRAFVFACPMVKLRQLGWQTMDVFRRVFPSFVSIFGKSFSRNTNLFLLEDNTLSVATFPANSEVPLALYSLPVDSTEKESIEIGRGKLLALADLENFEILPDILVAGEIEKLKDGNFKFEHEWLHGDNPNLELEQDNFLDSEDLWKVDLRSSSFKTDERKRRAQSRKKWHASKIWSLAMAAMLVLFLSLKIFEIKLTEKQALASQMATDVPLVIESRKLLEKLQQNKLGGIDPFGSIGRLYEHLGGSANDLNVWFTSAHFESRNELEIKGEGKNIESINTFIENLEKNKVANLQKGRGGDERRKIRSAGGKTSFEVDIELLEEIKSGQVNPVSETNKG